MNEEEGCLWLYDEKMRNNCEDSLKGGEIV
jgi:hypothetical protein